MNLIDETLTLTINGPTTNMSFEAVIDKQIHERHDPLLHQKLTPGNEKNVFCVCVNDLPKGNKPFKF